MTSGHEPFVAALYPETKMIVQEDDFNSELEQARSLLARSLGKDSKLDDPD